MHARARLRRLFLLRSIPSVGFLTHAHNARLDSPLFPSARLARRSPPSSADSTRNNSKSPYPSSVVDARRRTARAREDVNLPDASKFENLPTEERMLINGKVKLERFWKSSSYYLEETNRQDAEFEQYAEKFKRKGQQPQHFGTYMKLNVSHLPAELIQGEKRGQVDRKRLRWDTKLALDDFSLFEKLEEKDKNGNGKDNGVNEKKDGDEEAEEDLDKEEAESSEDDYAENQYFDDDEDDFNIDDDPEDDYYE